MIGKFPAVLQFNRLFPKFNRFICNQLPVLPDHIEDHFGGRLKATMNGPVLKEMVNCQKNGWQSRHLAGGDV